MNPLSIEAAKARIPGANVPPAIARQGQAAVGPASTPQRAELERYFPVLQEEGTVASGQVRREVDIEAELERDPQRRRLYDAAEEFEAMFINMMFKSMRKNLKPENNLLHGGFRQEVFEDMLYDEYAKSVAKSDGFDLGKAMYEQLTRSMPPVPGAESRSDGTAPEEAGQKSTEERRRMERAARSYDANTNSISTDQLWNENDWRP